MALFEMAAVKKAMQFSQLATRVAPLWYVNLLFVVFGVPLASCLVSILHIYIYCLAFYLSSHCFRNCI